MSHVQRMCALQLQDGSVRRSNTFEPGKFSGISGVQKLVRTTTYELFLRTHVPRDPTVLLYQLKVTKILWKQALKRMNTKTDREMQRFDRNTYRRRHFGSGFGSGSNLASTARTPNLNAGFGLAIFRTPNLNARSVQVRFRFGPISEPNLATTNRGGADKKRREEKTNGLMAPQTTAAFNSNCVTVVLGFKFE
ncbi:hypothetical protein C8F04DRAFT_1203077 [Mycena alexandri]|uniref:Uncharacterized protein n=1 Tax=Mycena alexandri TaxID=1745969 RepID=A0AAD6WM09_9AGAR|nr:hypothetical protein C8F04DRAFT_1203077 [Mycena alexandri]